MTKKATTADAWPPPTPELGPTGLETWRGVVNRWRLRPDELALLRLAVKTLDEADRLEAAFPEGSPIVMGSRGQPRVSPIVREVREHRLAAMRMIAALALSEESEERGLARSSAGRRLALARWNA
jgi:hypothetical protein